MKVRNNQKTLMSFDLPSGSLHLPGRAISRDLTEADMSTPALTKALNRKWLRVAREKPGAASVGTEPNANLAGK